MIRALLSWNGAAFALGASFLLFVIYCGVRWSIEDRAREWRRWRDEVATECRLQRLNEFAPAEPWFVRLAARWGSPRRYGF